MASPPGFCGLLTPAGWGRGCGYQGAGFPCLHPALSVEHILRQLWLGASVPPVSSWILPGPEQEPRVTPEHLKCAQSHLHCAESGIHTPHCQDLAWGKKKKKRHVKSPINICIYFLLKWYFKYISQIKYIIKISFPDFFFAALAWLLGSWKCGSYCPSPGHHGDSAILTRSLGPGWLLSTLLLYTLVLFCWPCVGLWVIIRSLGSDAVERAGLVGWCGWRFEGHAEEQQDRSKLSSFFFQSHLAGASSLILKPLPVGGEAQLPGHFGVEIGES